MFNLFRKKEPEPTPQERFFAAIDELNDAWADLPDGGKMRPWVDWDTRRVVGVVYRPELGREVVHG
jgi:hypothetical protein